MLSVLYFWLGLGFGLGLVDVALISALASCTYGLIKSPSRTSLVYLSTTERRADANTDIFQVDIQRFPEES